MEGLLLSGEWMPRINLRRCIGCGECINACPSQALAQRDGQAALVMPSACTYCAACETVCPAYAIELPYIVIRANTDEGVSRE